MNTSETPKQAEKDLFGITEGIFCQQCNCKGAYGAGISGAISKVFPEVEKNFRYDYQVNKGKQFGTYNIIQCTDKLAVANIYSQDTYGGRGTHTDISALATAVTGIAIDNPDTTIFLPHHYDPRTKVHGGIGAGLGGGNWQDVEAAIQQAVNENGLKNVALWDSIERRLDKELVPEEGQKMKSTKREMIDR